MMEGLKKEHGVTEVRNPIGNHIPMSWNGHETKIKIHMGEDKGKREGTKGQRRGISGD